MTINISQDDLGTLCICAIRYCQGRQTYMPSLVQGICRAHFSDFSDKDIGVMLDDCDFQERMNLYGDERIDKPNWMKWEADLLKEKSRRGEADDEQ